MNMLGRFLTLALVILSTPVLAGGSSSPLPIVGLPVLNGTNNTLLSRDNSGNLASTNTLPLVTPSFGASAATSFALGGATIGTNAVAVSGTSDLLPPVNGVALTISNQTHTAVTRSLSITQTQNSTGTNTGVIFANLIPGAAVPATTSLLLDLQYDSGSKFKVDRAGLLTTSNISVGVGSVTAGNFVGASVGAFYWTSRSVFRSAADGSITISNNGETNNFVLSAPAAAATPVIQLGALDVAAPIAQIIRGQSVVAGTTNTAGTNITWQAPAGTGTGAGGSHIFQVAPAGGTGTAQNAWAAALTLTSTGSIILGNAAIATTATDGFLYIPSGAGTPTGAPTTQTGRVALYYDTTNHQFWIYDGGWLQPKTPAGAALVTWQ